VRAFLFVTPLCFFLFFCKREWDKLVNLYTNGFDLEADGGVTAVSAQRLGRGSRDGREESPKISRSGLGAI